MSNTAHVVLHLFSAPLISPLTEIANFITKYFNLSKVYMCTDEGATNRNTMVCSPIQEIIHELKLVDYLLVQADKPC